MTTVEGYHTVEKKGKQGFASMTPERRREISSKGGKSVAPGKRSFALNKDLAVAAGRKGGLALSSARRSFTTNRELAAEAGKKGGATKSRKGRRYEAQD